MKSSYFNAVRNKSGPILITSKSSYSFIPPLFHCHELHFYTDPLLVISSDAEESYLVCTSHHAE